MSQYRLLKDVAPLYLLKLKKREELTKDVEEWYDFYGEDIKNEQQLSVYRSKHQHAASASSTHHQPAAKINR